GGRIPRRGDRLSPDPHVALLAPDRRGARPRLRRGGDHRAVRAAARHRQDRHPRPYPAEAGQARRRRVAGDAAPPRHRARDPEGQRLEVRTHGGPHRARPPREVRGLGLSERPGRRPYSALRPHRRGGRRLRRAHLGAALQDRLARGARLRIHHFTGRAAFRSAHGRCLSRHEVRGGADPARVAGPADGALMAVLGEHYARLRARLAARPDTEHEQAIVRLLVGTVLFFYLLPRAITHLGGAVDPDPSYFAVMVVYLVCAALIFADILVSPGVSVLRRLLAATLFDALARAEAANQAKRRFISVVSHEMRTPLNAIIGMSDLMRDTALTREQADMLQTLRSSSRVMLGLVEDVLDFSKIEA